MEGLNYTGTYVTEVKGTAPAVGYTALLSRYVEDRIDESLLTWAQQRIKKNQSMEAFLEEILSVFHRNADGELCIGSWMIRECMKQTGSAFFNAKKNTKHPNKTLMPHLIGPIEPNLIPLMLKKKPIKDLQKAGGYVHTVAMTTSQGGKRTSFFKAYESLPTGVTFTCTSYTDPEMMPEDLFKWWIVKTGSVGNYACWP